MRLVDDQGFEPRAPESTDLQSAAVANAARHPRLMVCMLNFVMLLYFEETHQVHHIVIHNL